MCRDSHAPQSRDLYNAPPLTSPGKDADVRNERMKTPPALQPLIDDGIIDEVIRSLKSGKEATVYVVRVGSEQRCAKVYRDMAQRSFQQRSQYRKGARFAAVARPGRSARKRVTDARKRKAPGRMQR